MSRESVSNRQYEEKSVRGRIRRLTERDGFGPSGFSLKFDGKTARGRRSAAAESAERLRIGQPFNIRQPLTKELVVVIWIGRDPIFYAAGSS